jgi:hypothetical protein
MEGGGGEAECVCMCVCILFFVKEKRCLGVLGRCGM